MQLTEQAAASSDWNLLLRLCLSDVTAFVNNIVAELLTVHCVSYAAAFAAGPHPGVHAEPCSGAAAAWWGLQLVQRQHCRWVGMWVGGRVSVSKKVSGPFVALAARVSRGRCQDVYLPMIACSDGPREFLII